MPVRKCVRTAIARGRARAVMIATLCSSFCTIQNLGLQLRSNTFPRGVPGQHTHREKKA